MTDRKDLVIIGSGPAGLSAAVYAQRAMLDQVVIEKEPFSGGQIITTERIDNYLGLYGMGGYELAMKFREHADALSVPFLEGEVTAINDDGEVKQITLASGETIETKAVLFATGARHKTLSVKGEKELAGAGVSYCATCDGAFFRGKTTAVVGGGDVALEDALYLSNICEKVYLIHRRDGLRGAKMLQQKIKETENIEFLPFYEVQEICGDGKVEKVILSRIRRAKREISNCPVSLSQSEWIRKMRLPKGLSISTRQAISWLARTAAQATLASTRPGISVQSSFVRW